MELEKSYSVRGRDALTDKLSKAIASFGGMLGSNKMGTLSQAWVPEPAEDAGIVLNTQGIPYSVMGASDLLALFRCISCKYKFTTDTSKPWLMGPGERIHHYLYLKILHFPISQFFFKRFPLFSCSSWSRVHQWRTRTRPERASVRPERLRSKGRSREMPRQGLPLSSRLHFPCSRPRRCSAGSGSN